jgi:hypothetical protein
MALLPIFCVARSSRTDLSMLVARALKIGKIADGGMPPTYETMHQMRAECRSVTDREHQFLPNTKKNLFKCDAVRKRLLRMLTERLQVRILSMAWPW